MTLETMDAKKMLDTLKDVERYFKAIDSFAPNRNRGTEGARIRKAVADAIAEAQSSKSPPL